MNRKLRIVFMGTPDFAVPSLKALHEAGFDIVAVVTVPDKPAGRGLQLHQSPVKTYAAEHNIPVLQPTKLKDPHFIETLKSLKANLQVVVAFRMLPQQVWQMPEYGTFNLHASLLPDYRGAAPINWAVMNGETETGITTFFLKHEIDTGDIIFREKMTVGPDEDAGQVHDQLMGAGAALVLKTVRAIEANTAVTIPQIFDHEPKPAPKIYKDTCKIDWENKNLDELHDFMRGLSPYPTAWTILDGKVLKIYKTKKEPGITDLPPGSIITDQKSYLKIVAKGGRLQILELQLEGRKRMGTEEFLRGYTLKSKMAG